MADPTLAVLLRNGNHDAATIRYALKCNDVAIAYARTPIQIPIAQQSPELIDLGFYRPSITCTGVVDTVGGDATNTTSGVAGMSSFVYTRATVSSSQWNDGGHASAKTYYIPYKNALEEAVSNWIFQEGDLALQIEIGDAKFPIASYGGYLDAADGVTRFGVGHANNHVTGGSIYKVAIQQGRFSLNAAREDRYDFSLQFVATGRLDTPAAA
ncbi:MAG: hypothetical protein CMI54_04045 [Parcubacteria group bacterium]|nr:hypothetical protein [Parcubacteria group bacterium]